MEKAFLKLYFEIRLVKSHKVFICVNFHNFFDTFNNFSLLKLIIICFVIN